MLKHISDITHINWYILLHHDISSILRLFHGQTEGCTDQLGYILKLRRGALKFSPQNILFIAMLSLLQSTLTFSHSTYSFIRNPADLSYYTDCIAAGENISVRFQFGARSVFHCFTGLGLPQYIIAFNLYLYFMYCSTWIFNLLLNMFWSSLIDFFLEFTDTDTETKMMGLR